MERENNLSDSKRENLGRIARDIKQHGLPEVNPKSDYLLKFHPALAAWNIWWTTGKKERYGVDSVIIKAIYENALQTKDKSPLNIALEFLQSKEKGDNKLNRDLNPISAVNRAFRHTFYNSMHLLFTNLEIQAVENSTEDEGLLSAYKRHKQFENFAKLNELPVDSGQYDIKIGIDTAMDVMLYTFTGITDRYRAKFADKELQPEELVAIARNSFPFVAKNSTVNIETLNPLILPEFEGGLIRDPQNLELIGENGKLRLNYSQEALDQIAEYEKGLDSPTFGCPAMVNFGDGSTVKKLWDWYCDTTEKVFEYQRSQNQPTILY